MSQKGLQNFSSGVLQQVAALLGRKIEGFVCNQLDDQGASLALDDLFIIATSAHFSHLSERAASKIEVAAPCLGDL